MLDYEPLPPPVEREVQFLPPDYDSEGKEIVMIEIFEYAPTTCRRVELCLNSETESSLENSIQIAFEIPFTDGKADNAAKTKAKQTLLEKLENSDFFAGPI